MQLRTISATALEVAQLCMARFKSEKIDYTPGSGGRGPANKGTVVHGVLEDYVRAVYINKDGTPQNTATLKALYNKHFEAVFNSADRTSDDYKDGWDQVERWFKRTDLAGVEVISTETKSFIEIKTSDGPKKYNYIWDRCDKFYDEDGKLCIRVVDYKTWRKNLTPDDLYAKIQCRMYAMAAAIQFKDLNPDEIWVQLDQTRYGTVEKRFSREDNVETWKYVKRQAELILATDPNTVQATVNAECGFCPIKSSCPELRKNVSGGGVHALTDDELARAKYEIESTLKGAKYALEEVEDVLAARMREQDALEWDTDEFEVKFKPGRSTRSVNNRQVARIIGPEIFNQIGTVTITKLNDLMKSGELTDEQVAELKKAINPPTPGSLKPVVTKKNGLEKKAPAPGQLVSLEAL